MPKKKPTKTRRAKKADNYSINGNTAERKKQYCPKCGPGVFMAEHKDREHCGKCGYTRMKNQKKEEPQSE
ncbi:30S ribosomal protein S27ae [archaeon]|nr:30S ribosomal protein S27ae [archaeon]